MSPLTLLAIFAHPDDESLGLGGALAKYAAEGVSTHLVTATRGEKGWPGPESEYPGPAALGEIRTAELKAAARELGLRSVDFLDYIDGELAEADLQGALRKIVYLVRSIRPQVVVTFAPDGAYGHPDHIAISQLTAGALVAAADSSYADLSLPPHRVSKLYFMVDSSQMAARIQELLGEEIAMEVDGVLRRMVAWPDWAVTTRLDLKPYWQPARAAILCHRSQLATLGDIQHLSDQGWCELTSSSNTYVRQYSLVPPGPGLETDLFAGLR